MVKINLIKTTVTLIVSGFRYGKVNNQGMTTDFEKKTYIMFRTPYKE